MNLNESYIDYLSERLIDTVKKLTTGKRKYAKYSDIKKELNCSDEDFNSMVKAALKSNRHSNKYIFTEVDDEPAVGITAMKRKRKAKEDYSSDDISTIDSNDDEEDIEVASSTVGESVSITPLAYVLEGDETVSAKKPVNDLNIKNENIPHFTLHGYLDILESDEYVSEVVNANKVKQIFKKYKNQDIMVFANGQELVADTDSLDRDEFWGTDSDGGEHEVKVKDVEYFTVNGKRIS